MFVINMVFYQLHEGLVPLLWAENPIGHKGVDMYLAYVRKHR